MPEVVKCKFNLFREGRKYTGHHRQYVLENAKAICYAHATREGIALREKYGFFGHGRRALTGKARLSEFEAVNTPGGSIVLENIPSNTTTFFEVFDDGTVEHHQEILESASGKIVQSLHNSKVGGFSWACGGADGGRKAATILTSFEGFDYVLEPGFADNKGYVLESANSGTRDLILESICQITGLDDRNAEGLMDKWAASAQYKAHELENRLSDAEAYELELAETNDRLKTEVEQANGKISVYESAIETKTRLIRGVTDKHHVVIPVEVADAMISMSSEADFHKVVGFFESAFTAEMSRLPLPGKKFIKNARPPKANIDSIRGYDFVSPYKF